MTMPTWFIQGSRDDGTYKFEVLINRNMTLGRDKYSAVPLVTRFASRRHFTFSRDESTDKWFIEDLESANGTKVNGKKLEPNVKHAIKKDDNVSIGSFEDPKNTFSFRIQRTTKSDYQRILENSKTNQDSKQSEDQGDSKRRTLNARLETTPEGIESVDLSDDAFLEDGEMMDDDDVDEKLEKEAFVKMESLSLNRVKHLIPSSLKTLVTEKEKETRKKRRMPSASSSSSASVLNLDISDDESHDEDIQEIIIQKDMPRQPQSKKFKGSQVAKNSSTFRQPAVGLSDDSDGIRRRSPRKTHSPPNKGDVGMQRNAGVFDVHATSEFHQRKVKVNQPTLKGNSDSSKQEAERKKLMLYTTPKALPRKGDEKTTASSRFQSVSSAVSTSSNNSISSRDPRLVSNLATPSSQLSVDAIIAASGKTRISHANRQQTSGASSSSSIVASQASRKQASQNILLKPASYQSQHVSSSSSHHPSSHVVRAKPKHNVDLFVELIVKWNPNWLRERKDIKEEPPVVPPCDLRDLKDFYDNHDDYLACHVPYILYEIFANFSEAFEYVNESSFVEAHIMGYESLNSFTKITFECPILNHRLRHPQEGDAILVELSLIECARGQSVELLAFGYVVDSGFEPRASFKSKHYSIPRECNKIGRCVVHIKKQHNFKINQQRSARIVRLEYIKPNLKHLESLVALKHSKLLTDILKPRKVTCQMPFPREGDIKSLEYNEAQHQAILGSSEAVQRGSTVAKIVLVQGPPGTGKTHTLIGIVQQIYKTWNPFNPHALPKILVCAPSNGAVDEIGKRLFDIRNFLTQYIPSEKKPRSIRCVRIGQDEQVRPDCVHMTLDSLVNANFKNSGGNLENKAKEIEKHIAEMDIEISNLRFRGMFAESEKVEKEMEKLSRDVDRIRKEQQMGGDSETRKRLLRDDILRKADIILTTLNSCRVSLLENTFNTDSDTGFTCVIVDEASQCSEPELLMPLYYTSISKMILIGDPMQLPATVKSVKASNAGFGRSLFERIFRFFKGYSDENPVHMLNQQFRMHKDICYFPSKQFYGGRLTSAEGSGEIAGYPLKAYTVMDVTETVQDTSNPKNITNQNEAIFVCSVLQVLEKNLKHQSSVGIITPYKGQKKLIIDKVSKLSFSNIKVDVNTIDGFQGQERHVIIFSSVRAFDEHTNNGSIGFMGSQQRMNVALTRAKYGLIVCLSRRSLEHHELWGSLIRDAEERNFLQKVPFTVNQDQLSKILIYPFASKSNNFVGHKKKA